MHTRWQTVRQAYARTRLRVQRTNFECIKVTHLKAKLLKKKKMVCLMVFALVEEVVYAYKHTNGWAQRVEEVLFFFVLLTPALCLYL